MDAVKFLKLTKTESCRYMIDRGWGQMSHCGFQHPRPVNMCEAPQQYITEQFFTYQVMISNVENEFTWDTADASKGKSKNLKGEADTSGY